MTEMCENYKFNIFIKNSFEKHLRVDKTINFTFQKRNDREEIRKRLAMGADSEEYYSLGHIDRPGKKPSLHSRLQNGML